MFFQYPEYYTIEMIEDEEDNRNEEYQVENEAYDSLTDS